ncbi:hypothetical protein Hanom_Chr05g00456811 [Helianthus anomalus]
MAFLISPLSLKLVSFRPINKTNEHKTLSEYAIEHKKIKQTWFSCSCSFVNLLNMFVPPMAKLDVFDAWGGGGAKTYIPKKFYRTGGSKTYIPKNFYTKTTYITLLSESSGVRGPLPAPSKLCQCCVPLCLSVTAINKQFTNI